MAVSCRVCPHILHPSIFFLSDSDDDISKADLFKKTYVGVSLISHHPPRLFIVLIRDSY